MKFYSAVPGSTYYFANGHQAIFAGGWYDATEEAEIKELQGAARSGRIMTEEAWKNLQASPGAEAVPPAPNPGPEELRKAIMAAAGKN